MARCEDMAEILGHGIQYVCKTVNVAYGDCCRGLELGLKAEIVRRSARSDQLSIALRKQSLVALAVKDPNLAFRDRALNSLPWHLLASPRHGLKLWF
jgi:hypothetical protein